MIQWNRTRSRGNHLPRTLLRRVQCFLGFQNKSCNCLSAENSYSMLCHIWPGTRSLQSRGVLWMRCISACRISCRTHRGITAIASHSLRLLSIYFPSSSIDRVCSRRSSDEYPMSMGASRTGHNTQSPTAAHCNTSISPCQTTSLHGPIYRHIHGKLGTTSFPKIRFLSNM